MSRCRRCQPLESTIAEVTEVTGREIAVAARIERREVWRRDAIWIECRSREATLIDPRLTGRRIDAGAERTVAGAQERVVHAGTIVSTARGVLAAIRIETAATARCTAARAAAAAEITAGRAE